MWGLKYGLPNSMSMSKTKEQKNSMFVDVEIVHDSIGVTHFLPPKRCDNRDD
jgi:hypothetical protein